MADDDTSLRGLYDAERTAYYRYQEVASGHRLVRGQRVSQRQVERFRQEWLRLRALLDAQADAEALRELLRKTTPVRRKQRAKEAG